MKRRRAAVGMVALVVTAGLAGWIAGRWIQSPAEVAARTDPPEPTAILAAVESRMLSSDVVTRGTARFGSPRTLALAPSLFKDGPAIVTTLPDPGTEVGPGEVLATVSGRPVFLFAGAQPMYRDLGPGMVGEDVRQLEAALSDLGFDPAAVDGAFDQDTAEAVTSLYRRAGHEPVVATEELLDSIRPLAAELVAGARAEAGVQVPADEVLFVANPPVRISELAVEVGDELPAPLMTVTDAVVAVDGSLPVAESRLVSAGMAVVVDEPDLGLEETGVVTAVAETPGTNGLDGFHVYLEVTVDGAPSRIVGASLRLTIPVETTSGAVLAVPVSALTLAADGSTRVQRVDGDRVTVVAVDPGLSADGYVEVSPLDGTLAPGDQVVVGYERTSDAALPPGA